jgi:membrane protein DedA with SNARE-associated domain
MDPHIAYILIFLITLVEGGEFAVLFSGFLLQLGAVTLWPAALVTLCAITVADMTWYRFGNLLYQLAPLRRLDPYFARLDHQIEERPQRVALLARFSYGIHHLTIARFRRNGISFAHMLRINLVTALPWLAVVGTVVMTLTAATTAFGHVFRFAQFVLAFGFVLFFFAEISASTYLRQVTTLLNDMLVEVFLPPTTWTKRFVALYGIALSSLFFLLIFTPILIQDGISIFSEEQLEVTLLAILTTAGFLVYRSYVHRLRAVQERYEDIVRHVGALNLQTAQVESMFSELVRLPANKRDLKRTLDSFNMNVLAAVQAPWVLTRLIDVRNGRTVTEQLGTVEGTDPASVPEVSNKALLTNGRIRGCYTYRSDHKNSYIRAACVVPKSTLNKQQEVVMKVAVNSIALLYLIFTSQVVAQDHETTALPAPA